MHLPSRRPTLLALALAVASALPAQQPAQFQAQQTSRKATADLVMGPVIDQMAFPFSDRAYLTNNQPTNIPSAEACREACADNIACLAWNFKHGNPHAAPPVPAGCSLFNVEERDRPSPIHAANFSSGARTSGNLHFPPPANNISMGQPMLNTLLTATDIPSNYLTTGITTAAGCSNACYLISDCTAYTMQSQYKPATASFTYACHLKNAGNGQTVANSPGFTSGMKRNPGTGFANPAIPGPALQRQPAAAGSRCSPPPPHHTLHVALPGPDRFPRQRHRRHAR
ncbi:MAG: PAN domain-containing protein [Acidobacteriota bacterium]